MTAPAPSGPPVDPRIEPTALEFVDGGTPDDLVRQIVSELLAVADAADRAAGWVRMSPEELVAYRTGIERELLERMVTELRAMPQKVEYPDPEYLRGIRETTNYVSRQIP